MESNSTELDDQDWKPNPSSKEAVMIKEEIIQVDEPEEIIQNYDIKQENQGEFFDEVEEEQKQLLAHDEKLLQEEDDNLFKEYYKDSETDEKRIQSFYDTVKCINRILAEQNKTSKSNGDIVLTFKELWRRGIESSANMERAPDIIPSNSVNSSEKSNSMADILGNQNIIEPEAKTSFEITKDDDDHENVIEEIEDSKIVEDENNTEQENEYYFEPDPGYTEDFTEVNEYKVKVEQSEETWEYLEPDNPEYIDENEPFDDENYKAEDPDWISENNPESQENMKEELVEDSKNAEDENSNESSQETKEAKYKCNFCDSAFTTFKGMKIHKKTVHAKLMSTYTRHPCIFCKKSFKGADKLELHIRKVHEKSEDYEDKKYKCDFEGCNWAFKAKFEIVRHVRHVHEGIKEAKCNQCQKVLASYKDLKAHVERIHEGKKNAKCDICGKMFFKSNDLRRHVAHVHDGLKTGTSGYEGATCELCNKHFVQKAYLKFHIRSVHEKIKDFKCEFEGCGKEFFYKHELNEHTKYTHQGIKEHFCHLCGKHLYSKKSLAHHIKTVHEKIKDFVCEHCQYACSEITTLKNHIKAVHDKIKDNVCQICGKAFALSATFKLHLKKHETLKVKYKNETVISKCQLCNKDFKHLGHLERHMRTVHNLNKPPKAKPFKCDNCSRTMVYRSEYFRHIKNSKCSMYKHHNMYLDDSKVLNEEEEDDIDEDYSNISENPWTPIESMEDMEEEFVSPEVKKEISSGKPKSKKSSRSHFMGPILE